VPISHTNILTNAKDVLGVIEANASDRLVSVLPLSHMLEFTGGFLVPALIGASVTYVKSLKAEDLLAALRDTKATILIGVPLLFEVIARNLKAKLENLPVPIAKLFQIFSKICMKHPSLGPILFYPIHSALGGNLRYFMAGGSKLHPSVFEFYRGIGILLLQGYGLTETSPVLTVTSPHNAAPDHVGKALPSVQIGIFDDKNQPLASGQEGEIWAKGPNVFRGYLDSEHNKGVFEGDWFRTGDLGNLDASGLLRITGRKKDIIVTGAGKNVYPEEIEGAVAASGLFLETCVLGMQDASGHEKICLVLVPDRTKFLGKTLEETKAAAELEAEPLYRVLSEYKWPQRIDVLFEELPKTITRKIKKHEVRKLLLEKDKLGKSVQSDGAEEGKLNLSNELEKTIANGISSINKIDPARIRLADSLTKDLGLDSLTFVELVSHVEKKFGTQIEGIDFALILTVRDLITALQFAATPKRKSFFTKVYFTNFSPRDNTTAFWRLPRRFLNVFLRALLKIRYDMQVEGLVNLREEGPYLFAPNHTSHFDMLSIAASVPGPMLHWTFALAAKDYFFNKTWKSLFVRIFLNAIPFDRKGRVDESMLRCREALDLGASLTIFPEGTRSPDGKLQAFKPGVGQLLAGHARAKAVPVYIEGAHGIMPKGTKFPGPGKLRIRYGKPISFRDLPQNAESYRKIAERLREEIINLSRAGH
jgi:long-chain acyl-CoA synthetase